MKVRHVVLLAGALLVAGAAQAQFQKPEDAVKYRQSAFSVLATHFGRIGAMTSGKAPFDAKVAQQNAEIVMLMSKLPVAGFTPESKGVKSRAKSEVWIEMAKVKAGSDKMVLAAAALHDATKTGNLDAVKKAFGETAATCKACHDAYRE